MTETRIDVKVEQVESSPADTKHPNTCPSCGSHYRDDELEAALYVCGQCGHHFRMPAHARIAWLADPDSFVEEAGEVRSADPLSFFDLRPYRALTPPEIEALDRAASRYGKHLRLKARLTLP